MSIAAVEPVAPSVGPSGNGFLSLPEHDPIRAELYGLEHLEAHARHLAEISRVSRRAVSDQRLRRHFLEIGRDLDRTRRWITEATRRQEAITTDAEWLLDNYHIIEDNLREVRQDLPRGYYRELPKLESGPFAGLPRVYALALELIAHTDSCLEEHNITRFVGAFQTVAPLTIGELWAVPIMLRLGLLENLQRLAWQMLCAREHRSEAESWKCHLIACKGEPRETSDHRLLAHALQPRSGWSDCFIVHLLQLLRDHGPNAAAGIEWLERHLGRRNDAPTEVVRREHQRQAANQVSVGNCVTSLRLLSALDWTLFFEHTSLVEAELRNDPVGVYGRQDFPTRDRYRRVVEKLARGSGRDELAVARRAVDLAGRHVPPLRDGQAQAHCGFYLVDRGRAALAADLAYRPGLADRFREFLRGHARTVYFGTIGTMLALILAGTVNYAWSGLAGGAALQVLLLLMVLLAVLVPASDLAVGLTHYLITLLLPPRQLPKMDFKNGIPAECTTFVVMPSMLVRPESGEVLSQRLEVHFLSNTDPQLRFALLTDFADAPAENMPEDESYLQAALAQVRALNVKYAGGGPDRFFLFHRRRQWNPSMNRWMGWERKRGKLIEFNRLLRGERTSTFGTLSGDPGQLPHIQYVITVDVDTRLSREVARQLVSTLAHPLNRPRFDPSQGRVVDGYGVLQPRVSPTLAGATRSLFARIFAGSAGIDPYTTAVSDVYQDLFGSGNFTGKGIYDVDAFEAAVGNTFPENQILSHDLIEGNHARCGLVTDIELLDDFPALYPAYARREHRWVRGDWQILPWLFRRVATLTGSRSNPLPLLERWKVFDNLRRSLVPPALVLLLLLGWTVLPGSPWFWTGLALAVLGLPLLLLLTRALAHLIGGGSWRLQWLGMRRDLGTTAGQAVLSLVFLAEQARLLLDAIGRTLVRLFVTHRNLLEWETAASTERRLGAGLGDFVGEMKWASLFAVLAAGLVLAVRPEAFPVAALVLFAWFISPVVAFWVSRPPQIRETPLTVKDRQELRRQARKVWHFFDTFVGTKDHGLPPDNYQEDPKGEVAHRTSPTNIGLYLLSSLAAHDLGYLSLPVLLERLENAFDTLDQLERYHGHIYNWYDTQTLSSLQPVYVSTVDSGNLMGCLLTLKQGLREKIEEPVVGPALRHGLADTLLLVTQALHDVEPPDMPEPLALFRTLEQNLQRLGRELDATPSTLLDWLTWLDRVHAEAQEMTSGSEALGSALHEEPEDLLRWVRAFTAQVRDRREELAGVAPWLKVLSSDGVPSPLPVSPEVRGASEPLSPEGRGASGTDSQQLWRQRLAAVPSIAEIQSQSDSWLTELAVPVPQMPGTGLGAQASPLHQAIEESRAAELLARCQSLADRAGALAGGMDFQVLYNEQRQLFSVGYNVTAGRLDNAHYDMLASEACLTSFLAIARGSVPRRHWFQLGRRLTQAAGGITLFSWGGTMFEYLMPRLMLRTYPGTLLEKSWRTAVDRQMEYGRENRVPWGISESAFSALDAHLDYQYQSFGVPGLGLKRGLSKDLVIAPYATALALAVHPRAAAENFRALALEKAEGLYGFYEAVDHTRDRMREKRRPAIVRSFMAHHQGMTLVALTNCLLGDPMPRRFHAEPMVRATELLLQERVPLTAPLVQAHGDEAVPAPVVRDSLLLVSRRLTTADTLHPRVQLLSNRQYSVMVTNAGAGYSTWRDLDVTRWREDSTRDASGQFCYVRDLRSGLSWSAGHQPVCRLADEYEVVYSTDKAEFRRIDAGIETHWEITVSAENSAEIRRVTITNHTLRARDIELTSYAEVVLYPRRADQAHPAFAKLFLETEFIPGEVALLCRRRPRAEDQKPVWAVHVLAVDGQPVGTAQYETDRARFVGRGRSPARPAALEPGATLSGTTGAVLDPIFSLRQRIRVAPETSVSVAFTTAVAESREEALALADQYHDFHGVNRAFELAWAHSQVELRHLHLSPEEAHLYQRLAGHVVYAGPFLRSSGAMSANRQGQQGLWRHGISGDRPIVVVRLAETEELSLVRQLLLAHTYWRLKGLEVDLVILNEHSSSYLEELHQQIQGLVLASDAHALLDRPGGVFVRRAEQISNDDRVLLQAAARVVLAGNLGSLASQIDRQDVAGPLPPRLVATEKRKQEPRSSGAVVPTPVLVFDNGIGGFTSDGREYVIRVKEEGRRTKAEMTSRYSTTELPPPPVLPPAPWINVVANPLFGFLASESGLGYTWAGNSQANRLTGWSNDPVSDPPGEVIYLRDEVTGEVWTPTPLPRGGDGGTAVYHGQGYTRFTRESQGLAQELLVLVPLDDSIKLLCLKVRNRGQTVRRLSATFFAEWVLGTVRDQAPMQVVCSLDPATGALLARNAWNADFASRLAFADVSLRPRTVTADRAEFLGRNGTVEAPAALARVDLSGSVGPLRDPCAALMTKWELRPGEEKEVVFFLGEAAGPEEVQRLLRRYREPGRVRRTLDEVRGHWDRVLGAVQVRTPDPALDLLLNRWLLYQVLSCRLWGRSAFYQSGGAYGFRDQLQDVMALVHAAPQEARAHLLRAASREFLEGDVQHWWHPPAGRGVRTRFSDDLLWLPLTVCHYAATTGDRTLLDERVPFLRAPVLKPGQEEDYGLPEISEETGTVYDHCVRTLERGFQLGEHGLPLMGTGDWNDGMNRVGAGGKGESVWNGWFLVSILRDFAALADRRSDATRATWCRERAESLRTALEEHAWDGRWYRRAYFDDGTPLGSEQNDECKIDSIVQSWAVIASSRRETPSPQPLSPEYGGEGLSGQPLSAQRCAQAMAAVEKHLVREADKLILLFTPPFDQGKLQPGYIKGYVPGIRENGGQYTHAAIWVVQATALLGHGTRAMQLVDLLNPIRHALSPAEVARYRVEPYVVAADIYSQPPHTGRGGWTWYTGSASWLYRVVLETILGFQRRGNILRIDPCIASQWPGYEIIYRHASATYHIVVKNPAGIEQGVQSITLDGQAVAREGFELADDGRNHEVRVVLGL